MIVPRSWKVAIGSGYFLAIALMAIPILGLVIALSGSSSQPAAEDVASAGLLIESIAFHLIVSLGACFFGGWLGGLGIKLGHFQALS